jgi:hypothetical protein
VSLYLEVNSLERVLDRGDATKARRSFDGGLFEFRDFLKLVQHEEKSRPFLLKEETFLQHLAKNR